MPSAQGLSTGPWTWLPAFSRDRCHVLLLPHHCSLPPLPAPPGPRIPLHRRHPLPAAALHGLDRCGDHRSCACHAGGGARCRPAHLCQVRGRGADLCARFRDLGRSSERCSGRCPVAHHWSRTLPTYRPLPPPPPARPGGPSTSSTPTPRPSQPQVGCPAVRLPPNCPAACSLAFTGGISLPGPWLAPSQRPVRLQPARSAPPPAALPPLCAPPTAEAQLQATVDKLVAWTTARLAWLEAQFSAIVGGAAPANAPAPAPSAPTNPAPAPGPAAASDGGQSVQLVGAPAAPAG